VRSIERRTLATDAATTMRSAKAERSTCATFRLHWTALACS
jgi:hypothetical protein